MKYFTFFLLTFYLYSQTPKKPISDNILFKGLKKSYQLDIEQKEYELARNALDVMYYIGGKNIYQNSSKLSDKIKDLKSVQYSFTKSGPLLNLRATLKSENSSQIIRRCDYNITQGSASTYIRLCIYELFLGKDYVNNNIEKLLKQESKKAIEIKKQLQKDQKKKSKLDPKGSVGKSHNTQKDEFVSSKKGLSKLNKKTSKPSLSKENVSMQGKNNQKKDTHIKTNKQKNKDTKQTNKSFIAKVISKKNKKAKVKEGQKENLKKNLKGRKEIKKNSKKSKANEKKKVTNDKNASTTSNNIKESHYKDNVLKEDSVPVELNPYKQKSTFLIGMGFRAYTTTTQDSLGIFEANLSFISAYLDYSNLYYTKNSTYRLNINATMGKAVREDEFTIKDLINIRGTYQKRKMFSSIYLGADLEYEHVYFVTLKELNKGKHMNMSKIIWIGPSIGSSNQFNFLTTDIGARALRAMFIKSDELEEFTSLNMRGTKFQFFLTASLFNKYYLEFISTIANLDGTYEDKRDFKVDTNNIYIVGKYLF
ncbi:MAG: hypothetical protein N4A33_10545 [Bacteriovoracaceae bacterium]|jgi:hypothetical protein|nr:hypothetical protein [Bacteriovoracaceae bacterium]